MSSVKSLSPPGDAPGLVVGHQGEIVKCGTLKKLKTMKKKYFVLRCESVHSSARLEYYDSERKFKAHQAPKRSISLKTCFNINKRTDTKQKYVIALYTKDDCFCIVLESEEERDSWLRALLLLQNGEDCVNGETPKPIFEHVWQVDVADKGLGHSRKISGPSFLCLTISGKTVSLVKHLSDGNKEILEFPLKSIRSCGEGQCFFFMELGRNAVTGTGEIWMQVEDVVIAKDMHRVILGAMKTSGDDGSKQIGRSASVSESSKPASMMQRRQTHSSTSRQDEVNNPMPSDISSGFVSNVDTYCEMNRGPYGISIDADGSVLSRTGSVPYNFMYCQTTQRTFVQQHLPQNRPNTNVVSRPNQRRHSVSGSSSGRDRSDSLPSTMRVSSESHAYPHGHHAPFSTRGGHPHSHLVPSCHRPHSVYTRCISHSPPVGVGSSPVSPPSGGCSTDSAGSSLSIDETDGWVEGTNADNSVTSSSRYGPVPAHTPESPIEEENCDDYVHWNGPSAPDSGVGDEEKLNNYMSMDRSTATLSLPIQQPLNSSAGPVRKFSPSFIATTANNNPSTLKSGSPSHTTYTDVCSPCGSSPLDTTGGYMTMSPGNIPDNARNIMYNRTGGQTHTAPPSANHSRASSLAEETPDGYTPMMPGHIDNSYVDMDHSNMDAHDFHHLEVSPSSSCSVTSGTPSTDLRFSEYPLEKVNSYLTPSEDDEMKLEIRPTRCYSVGSKPDSINKKNRLEIINQIDCPRVRAFSVGSRNTTSKLLASRPLAHDLHATRQALQAAGHFTPPSHHRLQQHTGVNKKSSSAPILSGSLVGSPMNRHLLGGSHSSVEPMDDLMEMDFSNSTSFKPGRAKSGVKSGSRSKSSTVSEPLGGPGYHSSQSSVASSYSTADGSYLDMSSPRISNFIGSPRTSESGSAASPPKPTLVRSALANCVGRSPPDTASTARSPPSRSTGSPRSAVTRMSCIAELKPQTFPSTTPSPPIKQSLLATNNSTMAAKIAKKATPPTYVEMGPANAPSKPVIATSASSKSGESGPYVEMKGNKSRTSASPSNSTASPRGNSATSPGSNEDYMDMNFKPRKTSVPEGKEVQSAVMRTAPLDTPNAKKPPEGYVDMSWHKPSRKSSLDSYCVSGRMGSGGNSDDYIHMSAGSAGRNRKERRGVRRDRQQLKSQPINIQHSGQQVRKISVDTPAKGTPGYLPVGSPMSSPFPSLGRNNSRKSSKDSCNSVTSGLTTPTGSNSTIFPMSINSPGSPLKPFPAVTQENIIPVLASAPGGFDNLEKVPADISTGTLRLSYPGVDDSDTGRSPAATLANLDESPPQSTELKLEHDYVNINPNSQTTPPPLQVEQQKKAVQDESGDYAVMCPASTSQKHSKNSETQKKNVKPLYYSSSKKSSEKVLNFNLESSSLSTEPVRPSSEPLTVSSLLGMNNLSLTSEPLNNLNSSSSQPATGTPKLSSSSISPLTRKDYKVRNCETPVSSCNPPRSTASVITSSTSTTTSTVTCPTLTPISSPVSSPTSTSSPSVSNISKDGAPTTPNPSVSPCPSPNGDAAREKMLSGSDSSIASRDSQLLVRKYSAGNVSPGGPASKTKIPSTSSITSTSSTSSVRTSSSTSSDSSASRRLSCPNKTSISRQASVSSEASEVSQTDDSRIPGLSRQTSNSSAVGETAASNLTSTEKRSLSCSPVPASVSPVPRPVEREINYASLDLRQTSDVEDGNTRSPRGVKTQSSHSDSGTTSSSHPPDGAFTYAQIDFEKSEELRKANAAKNAKQ